MFKKQIWATDDEKKNNNHIEEGRYSTDVYWGIANWHKPDTGVSWRGPPAYHRHVNDNWRSGVICMEDKKRE